MKKEKALKHYKPGSFRYVFAHLRENRMAFAGLIIILALLVLSFTISWLSPYAIDEINMQSAYKGASAKHWFGCDELGRDIFTRVIAGAKYTLSVGLLSVIISALFGISLGAIAGYFGGMVDQIIMRFLDVMAAFPSLLLAITISAVLGRGLDKCIIALGLAGVPGFARMMRANILTVRGQEYIEACMSINCGKARIIMKHVIPNAISPLIVSCSMAIANAGLNAAAMSFIGLGVTPPTPEWGAMLSSARNYISRYPHMVLFPGLAIMVSVLCLNLVGDAVRDALDPKLKD